VDAGRAPLKQAIGEAASGGPDIEAYPAGGVDLEMIERAFEFRAAAADEAGFGEEGERGVEGEFGAGLVDLAVTAADFAREDEALRLLAGGGCAWIAQFFPLIEQAGIHAAQDVFEVMLRLDEFLGFEQRAARSVSTL
jgi:hypothetical protein